jgi:hypothetical protein
VLVDEVLEFVVDGRLGLIAHLPEFAFHHLVRTFLIRFTEMDVVELLDIGAVKLSKSKLDPSLKMIWFCWKVTIFIIS